MLVTDADRRDCQFEADLDLRRYKDAQSDIRHYKYLIDRLQARADAVSRPLDPDRLFVQHDNSSPEDILLQIVDMQREYGRKQLQAEKLCMELEHRISNWTSGLEARILRSCYLFNRTLEWIAVQEEKSYSQIKRLKWKALENYGKNLKNEPQ